jgi:ribosome maturation protein SDO1
MRVRVSMPTADGTRLREKVVEGAEKIEDEVTGQEEWEVVCRLDILRLSFS